jgi:hypothetical protein
MIVIVVVPHPFVQRFGWLPRIGLADYTATMIGACFDMGPFFSLGWVANAIETAILTLPAVDVHRAYGSPAGLMRAAVASVGLGGRSWPMGVGWPPVAAHNVNSVQLEERTMSLAPRTRPIGITILAVVALLGGLLNILVGTDLLGLSGATTASDRGDLAVPVGILMLLSAALFLVDAYGLWALKAWGWTLAVVLMVLAFLLNLLQYLNDNTLLVPMLVSAVIPAAILWYLFQPNVKAAFDRT